MEAIGTFEFDSKSCYYKFIATRVISRKVDFSVVRIVGEHLNDNTNEDVEAVSFSNFKLIEFPKNLGYFFPNLKYLSITNCGLTYIYKYDLMGLPHLKHVNLNGNSIKVLPNNLFENNSKLEAVSLYLNRIEFIGRNIFDSLDHLSYINLKMNASIDVCFKNSCGISFNQLRIIIERNCQPKLNCEIDEFF